MSTSQKERKLKRVVIREELVALTGDHVDALILGQMLYWTERMDDFDKFMDEEKKRDPELALDYQDGWIYKTAAELLEELMLSVSGATLSRRLDKIVHAGWLARRHNPKYKWDRTWQYHVNLRKIENDLNALGYHLEGYRFDPAVVSSSIQNEVSFFHHADSKAHQDSALPEITPEITPESTSTDIPEDTVVSSVAERPAPPSAQAQEPPAKRVTWRTEIISEAQEYLWSQFGRKRWHTRAELDLFVKTERAVGIEVMMRAVHWAAENGIAKVPSVCSAARKMWSETPAARASPPPPRQTREVRVVYSDGDTETMEIPI